jgi:hypothetical protein
MPTLQQPIGSGWDYLVADGGVGPGVGQGHPPPGPLPDASQWLAAGPVAQAGVSVFIDIFHNFLTILHLFFEIILSLIYSSLQASLCCVCRA